MQFGDVFLPPQILLAHSHSTEEVVEVHDSVDETVEQGGEEGAAPWHEHHRVPRHESDARVVVEVEEGDLVELLPHQHEPGVEELHELGRVVPPTHRQQLQHITNHVNNLSPTPPPMNLGGNSVRTHRHFNSYSWYHS